MDDRRTFLALAASLLLLLSPFIQTALAGATHLRWLDLSFSHVGLPGISALRGLPLRSLHARGLVLPRGIADVLLAFPHLHTLDVRDTKMPMNELRRLRRSARVQLVEGP